MLCAIIETVAGWAGGQGGQQPLRLSHHLPLPWQGQGAPTLMLEGQKAPAYLVTPAADEPFEALPANALAAIQPVSRYLGPGYYLVEEQERLDLRRLEAEATGLALHGKLVSRWVRLDD